MFVPTTNDNVGIFINGKFYFFHITCFDVMFLHENKLFTVPVKLCHTVITLDMNMDRLMLFAVKKE